MIGFGQLTYVPDSIFENYLETHTSNGMLCVVGSPWSMGNGIGNDSNVFTSAISLVTLLDFSWDNISDLTGVEDFISLTHLYCDFNNLTSLNVSQNTALTYLYCGYNQLTNLDVSNNTSLFWLSCGSNNLTSLDVNNNILLSFLSCDYNYQITSLDVSNNINLNVLYCNNIAIGALDVSNNTDLNFLNCSFNWLSTLDVSNNTSLNVLSCHSNQLTSLDVSNNTALYRLDCQSNQLISLDVKNGNNQNFSYFISIGNPNLSCINVDDVAWSASNWTVASGNIDTQHYFSNNCSGTAIEEYAKNKEPLRIIDILGRESKPKKNQPLFYLYSDGAIEKKIINK